MSGNESMQRVRIYLRERDASEGQPLYLALLERLRNAGASGATALRGVAGFGPRHWLRAVGPSDSDQSPPVVIEWVERAERVARLLPELDALLPEVLITVEDVRVYRAVMRSVGRFGERAVGEVIARDVAVAGAQMPLHTAAQLLLERDQALLPVLDSERRVAGVLASSDLARRAGLPLPLPLLRALAPDERAPLLAALAGRELSMVMNPEPRTISVEASIPQALNPLIEWGLEALPVVDRAGCFVGLFGVEQALRAGIEASAAQGPVRDAEPPTPVWLVMQTAVPSVSATTPLSAALAPLLTAVDRFLVVLESGRPLGILDAAQILRQLSGPARAAWIEALRAGPGPIAPTIAQALGDHTAGDLLGGADAPTIGSLASQDEATRMMLEQGHERLLVVDEAGRLAGLLARQALLRALAQVSFG